MTDQPLFQPVRLGGLDLPNRVLMAPMTRARTHNPELAPGELQATYYAQRATAGLIISEGTWVNRDAIGYLNVPGIYTDTQTQGWAQVTAAVHEAGGRITSQLGHVGALSHPDHHNGRLPAGPSAVNPRAQSFTSQGMQDTVTPRALTTAEIKQTIADYRTAAANAKRAGFDGVEIHAQTGHLLAQFLNPHFNQRTDSYGGSKENRARILLDILHAITENWDTARISVKLSPHFADGNTFIADEETLAGYDHLIGNLTGLAYLHLVGPAEAAERRGFYTHYRELYQGNLVANLGFTKDSANELIGDGLADAVAFGAPFIANPDLVARFAHDHPLAEADRETYYAGHSNGYTDYPPVS
ncbi:alkene reductase [Crossiella cryophila]|uniref:N-ethylmaleimide reductase n=1 Tax=Crossiella cryophila TaxID=43355 RepID=A0A7W7FWK1_9PSEU|nr:alkene reductase [Crossiella cryophila]MBB4680135.1 N-ethylmaleimide reductase [Crossiella cryophila]